MNKQTSIPFSDLVDWIEGHLSDREAEEMEARVAAADAATQANVAWLRNFYQISEELQLVAAPAGVRQRLLRRFRAFAAGEEQEQKGPGLLERLVATLSFDSGLNLAPAGVRSTTLPGQQRQLVYTTGVADVVLNVQPHLRDQQVDVIGQILPLYNGVPSPYSVQLLQEDHREAALTLTDDLGEFTFTSVVPGVYNMILSGERRELILPAVKLYF